MKFTVLLPVAVFPTPSPGVEVEDEGVRHMCLRLPIEAKDQEHADKRTFEMLQEMMGGFNRYVDGRADLVDEETAFTGPPKKNGD